MEYPSLTTYPMSACGSAAFGNNFFTVAESAHKETFLETFETPLDSSGKVSSKVTPSFEKLVIAGIIFSFFPCQI